jgi:hypothetical protein
VLIVRPIPYRRREIRSPIAALKWQPARDLGARVIMRMALPTMSRASPMDFE